MCVEDLACDRCRCRTPIAAAFHHHRHGDGRVFRRRIAHEQRTVALVQGQRLGIHRLRAAVDHLRGAGLARHAIRRADAHRPCRTARPVDGHLHALLDHAQVFRIFGNAHRRRLRQGFPRRIEMRALRGHQVWTTQHAAVGQCRSAARQLQRRHLPHALADGSVDQVARIPAFLVEFQLGRRRRQDAADFAHQVDAGRLAETVLGQVGVEALHAQIQRQPVVVGIHRIGDRLARIGPAVATTMRVAPTAAGHAWQAEHTGGQGLVLGLAHPAVHARQCK